MSMEQRSYVISIEYDEQFRTTNRSEAKALYNLVDEHFVHEVDGLKKQLIEVDANGWDSRVLFEDVIHCPKISHDIGEEDDDDVEEQEQMLRGFRR